MPRIDVPGVAQHVIQRGNNRHLCFASDEEMAVYANWLEEYARRYHVEVHKKGGTYSSLREAALNGARAAQQTTGGR